MVDCEAAVNGPRKVQLLEADPDLGGFLGADERELAERVAVPVLTLEPGAIDDLDVLLEQANAFAAIVLSGLLLRRMLIGEQSALRLHGPGDVVALSGYAGSALLLNGGYHAAAGTELALLDDHALLAVRRFPRLVAGLQVKMADQQERLAAQLVISHLPRVEDRVLGMLWWLAESFGHVTRVGTVLPLTLTHDALGELVGAKRPTVTLAVRELTERGALVRQDQGWLLLQQLERPGVRAVASQALPELTDGIDNGWAPIPSAAIDDARSISLHEMSASLRDTVEALRRDHAHNTDRVATRTKVAADTRERSRQIRARIQAQRLRPQAPS
jgi:CRP-like cAMP-binding protein